MRASREIRMAMNRLRRRWAQKNGVVSSGCLDIPWMERQAGKDDKARVRHKAMRRHGISKDATPGRKRDRSAALVEQRERQCRPG